MSVAFLECKSFNTELECCPNCHKDKLNLILVQPFRDEAGNVDWDLCIEAYVCCHLYHYVRALPRSFWLFKSIELGVRRDDGNGYLYPESPERNVGYGSLSSQISSKIRRPKVPKDYQAEEAERERSSGLAGFLGRRR